MHVEVRGAGIPQLVAAVEGLTGEVRALVAPLSAAQLNWKPNAEEWSLGQCLEHVIIANGSYFAPLERLLAGRPRPSFWERLPVLPGLYARMLITALEPSKSAKVPTAKSFMPASSAVSPEILERFGRQQARLVELMRACAHLDAAKVIITSPAAPFVTYSLLDAFRIIVVHEQHHLVQTTRMTRLPGFPAG